MAWLNCSRVGVLNDMFHVSLPRLTSTLSGRDPLSLPRMFFVAIEQTRYTTHNLFRGFGVSAYQLTSFSWVARSSIVSKYIHDRPGIPMYFSSVTDWPFSTGTWSSPASRFRRTFRNSWNRV